MTTLASAPVVLITGASTGLGRVSAELLAASGYRVFGTSRAPRPDHALPYTMLPLDVRSDESVAACVAMVLAQVGRIDVLINNAGHGLAGAIEEASLEQVQGLFETNFFGVVRMTNAVLPHMRRRRSGKIINISSAAGFIGTPFEGFYNASKHALEGYSEALRHEVRPLGVWVALVEPGFFLSQFGQANQAPAHTIADYAAMRGRASAVFNQSLIGGADPQAIAALILRIVRSRRPRLRHLIGVDARLITLHKRLLPEPAFELLTRLYFRLDNRPIPEAIIAGLMRLFGGTRPVRPEARVQKERSA